MNPKTCQYCAHHRAVQITVIEDEDGERPVFQHYCYNRPLSEAELWFGCGAFKERTI